MNAYELADWFDKDGLVGNMLRQQADRIAELEKQLAFMEGEYPEPTIVQKMQEFANLEQALNRIAELEKLLQESAMHNISITAQADEHYARVKELEKDLYMIQRHYDQLETFSSSGNSAQDVDNTNETLPKGKV